MRTKRLECSSVAKGPMSKGCELCTEGSKMVLFITGRCDTGCPYCPISEEKMGMDSVYANEARVTDMAGVIEEAEMMDALGTGITGGDPLLDIERTIRAIVALKERFGSEHHIHLYTSTIDAKKAKRLKDAGLDEIRFHPSSGMWTRLQDTGIADVLKIDGLAVGLEVPALPDKEDELAALIDTASKIGVHFINLNELEFSESNWDMMENFGYDLKDEESSAILGSEDVAVRMIRRSGMPIHFCSSSFKDSIQLRRRLIRRAEHIARPSDIVTEDGTILKGILYADDMNAVVSMLKEDYDVPDELMFIDLDKKRLEVAPWVLEEICSELPYKCYIIEEYPTSDRLEVERSPL